MIFYLSKLLWLFFNPFNLILIFFIIGFISNLIKYKKISLFFYISSLLIFFIAGVLPTGSYLNYLLEKKFHETNYLPNTVDGILILSGATNPILTKEYNQINLNSSVERLIESILLIKKYPKALIVFSGGLGHARVARDFFYNMDISLNNFIFEKKSRNTFENILFSKKMIDPKSNERWLIVTSAFHMDRSLAISKKLEWKFIPYVTDFNQRKNFSWKLTLNFLDNFYEFEKASHEWVGLISYYFLGRSAYIF